MRRRRIFGKRREPRRLPYLLVLVLGTGALVVGGLVPYASSQDAPAATRLAGETCPWCSPGPGAAPAALD